MSFAEKLNALMHDRQMTKADIACATGLNYWTIYHWTRGDTEPSLFTLKLLTEALNCKAEELFPD